MYKPINTDKGGVIYARASILGIASPVMKNMLKQSKSCGRRKSISVRGVPHQAVRDFIRLLSSCYEQEEMNEYILPLLVLPHVFVVPPLNKGICWNFVLPVLKLGQRM